VTAGDPSASSRRAIIFDLDGVLIDSETLQYEAYSQVLARYGVRVSIEEYAAQWIATGCGPEYAVQTFGLPVTPDELRAQRSAVYPAIMRERVTLMPGAAAALTRFAPHFALAVATNSNQSDVSFVMDHFDLRGSFAAIVTREHYDRAKPAPDAYRAAAAQLNVAPSACLVVEDTQRGVLAAHRAGAHAVAVPNALTRDNDFSVAVAVLNDLDELTVEVANQLLARGARAISETFRT